jgi:hypothetical protein
MKKVSTFFLCYDINPEEKSSTSREYNKPEWQLYLIDEEEVHICELKKPSEFDSEERVDPYKIFPALPVTPLKDRPATEAGKYTVSIEECEPPDQNLSLNPKSPIRNPWPRPVL